MSSVLHPLSASSELCLDRESVTRIPSPRPPPDTHQTAPRLTLDEFDSSLADHSSRRLPRSLRPDASLLLCQQRRGQSPRVSVLGIDLCCQPELRTVTQRGQNLAAG